MAIHIAIVGLGRVGSLFFDKMAEREGKGIRIVAVAQRGQDHPVAREAQARGIRVFQDGFEMVERIGGEIDVLFDLTGDPGFRQKLRDTLARSGNHHTVIAPELIAHLIWALIANGGEALPVVHRNIGY